MSWLLQNFDQRLRFLFRNPRYALGSLYRELMRSDERFLTAITGVSSPHLRSLLGEPLRTREFAARLREAESTFRPLDIQSADLYAKKVLLQYVVIRALQPSVVVETGVANGVSSAYLLLALQKNGRGVLHSIEIGDARFLPPGKAAGWLVPEWLKPNWDLRIGDSRQLLPSLLAELGTIDVFIHDSLHTYEHMLWEFRTAYPHIRPGGLLCSDDALWNSAFPEFSRGVQAQRARILRGVGFLQKNRP